MRITDSQVLLASDSRQQRNLQHSSQMVSRPLDGSESMTASARLSVSSEKDISALASCTIINRLSGDAEAQNRLSATQEVLDLSIRGREAWQALALQGERGLGDGLPLVAGATLQVEYTVEQQVDQFSLFTASGVVNTGDGQSVRFQLGLQMQSSLALEGHSEFILKVQERTDPLVLNFAAETASLTDTVFSFDVNADGIEERIASLGAGSGYLVFDKNANGIADDGSELFGAATGNGFAELAAFDQDQNRWLDESDPLFDKLSLWVDLGGESQLRGLRELGVGAIYLGASAETYDLTSRLGVPLGRISAQGLMLMENGEVRSVQQLDLYNQQKVSPVQVQTVTATVSAAAVETVEESSPQDLIPGIGSAFQAVSRKNTQQEQLDEALKPAKSMLEQLLEAMVAEQHKFAEARRLRHKVEDTYHGGQDRSPSFAHRE